MPSRPASSRPASFRPAPSRPAPRRPPPAELAAAAGRAIPDLVAPGVKVLFVGINPGLWSGATSRHFANPGNRLWTVLHRAGFTSRRLRPEEIDELLALGYGVTNLVARATATAAELAPEELRAGAAALVGKVTRLRPAVVAFLGLGAYRVGFARPKAQVGPQAESIAGARAWLLPNPSGLNAHYQVADLVRLYAELREAVDAA